MVGAANSGGFIPWPGSDGLSIVHKGETLQRAAQAGKAALEEDLYPQVKHAVEQYWDDQRGNEFRVDVQNAKNQQVAFAEKLDKCGQACIDAGNTAHDLYEMLYAAAIECVNHQGYVLMDQGGLPDVRTYYESYDDDPGAAPTRLYAQVYSSYKNQIQQVYQQLASTVTELTDSLTVPVQLSTAQAQAVLDHDDKKIELPELINDDYDFNLKVWNTSTHSEQRYLEQAYPHLVGNLNGLPTTVLDAANRYALNQDLDKLQALRKIYNFDDKTFINDPYKFGPKDEMDRLANALQTHLGLEAQQFLLKNDKSLPDNLKNAPVRLTKYDSSFIGGAASYTIGDRDHAANSAFVVSGLGSSVRNGELDRDHAFNIFRDANIADPTRPTAVTFSMNWHPAQNFDEVSNPGLAREGAYRFAAEVNGAGDASVSGQNVSVFAHSYGSTMAADAGHYGMKANNLILVGSPGLDEAKNAAGTNIEHCYIGDSSHDIVGHLGSQLPSNPIAGLGNDPAQNGSGFIRFKAENPDSSNPLNFGGKRFNNWTYDHSQYFNLGSQSLYSMTDIASGHRDLLGPHDMLAPSRHDNSVVPNLLKAMNPVDSSEILELGIIETGLYGGADPESADHPTNPLGEEQRDGADNVKTPTIDMNIRPNQGRLHYEGEDTININE